MVDGSSDLVQWVGVGVVESRSSGVGEREQSCWVRYFILFFHVLGLQTIRVELSLGKIWAESSLYSNEPDWTVSNSILTRN